jgi:hypothetical protein
MKTPALVLAILIFTSGVRADTRTSTKYSITTDTTDGGGKRATSAAYANYGSAGGTVLVLVTLQ